MKIKIIGKTILVITILLCGTLFTPLRESFAEEAPVISMAVSPMSQTISLTPGERYEGKILITNTTKATTDLVYTAKVGAYSRVRSGDSKDDYGGVDVETRTNYNIMADWIILDNENGTISPNSEKIINFTINVPMNAPAGAQYASILVTNNPNDNSNLDNEGALIKNKTQLVATIVANVAGKTIEKGSIINNDIPSFLLNNPLEATSMVRNDGNIYTDASYILQVWPLFSDEEICTNEEKPETNLVLPETERYHVQNCNLPIVGVFKAKQVVKIFGETSITEKTIIVCPIWLMLIIFFVIAAIIIWIVMRVRGRRKSAKRESVTKAE